jgi:hypothetical protein
MSLTAYTPASRTLGATRTADANNLADAWKDAALQWSQTEDFLGQWEGKPGSGNVIAVSTDLKAGRGDRVHVSVFGDLGGSGQISDDELEGFEEVPDEATFEVDIDQFRHAVAYTELARQMTNQGGSLDSISAEKLGRWLAARKQTHALLRFIKGANGLNTLRPDAKTRDLLLTADTLDTSLADNAAGVLGALGANPAMVKVAGSGATIESYLCAGDDQVMTPLRNDDRYENMLLHAQVRGDSNETMKGGYAKWNGHTFYHLNVKDGKTRGALRTPLTPKAKLGDAITAGTTAISVYGSGKTQSALGDYASYYKPFEYFAGYDFLFTKKQVAAPDSGTYYFVIYNVTGSDAGKFGVYSYVGSDCNGNRITITNRLGSAVGGARVTSLAGQTYSSLTHTDAHPTGSLIIPVNAKCVPVAYSLFFGADAMVRCYGKTPIKRLQNVRDYAERRGEGIKSIFGQNVAKDTDGQPSGYVLLETAYAPVGVRLPVISS